VGSGLFAFLTACRSDPPHCPSGAVPTEQLLHFEVLNDRRARTRRKDLPEPAACRRRVVSIFPQIDGLVVPESGSGEG